MLNPSVNRRSSRRSKLFIEHYRALPLASARCRSSARAKRRRQFQRYDLTTPSGAVVPNATVILTDTKN